MNIELTMKIFRVVVPCLLFIATFAALTLFTNLHWMVRVVLGICVGLLDVFIFTPMTKNSVDKKTKD